jgi:VWFA-related protein
MFRTVWAFAVAAALALAQQGGGPPVAAPEPVLRVSVNLVQVDAVVTDSHGQQVTNLTADDFDIREDGRPQKITAFSYVKTAGPQPVRTPSATTVKGSIAPSIPPVPQLTAQQVRRTVVLMVDDLGLSLESMRAGALETVRSRSRHLSAVVERHCGNGKDDVGWRTERRLA